jgi:hypothetical protein
VLRRRRKLSLILNSKSGSGAMVVLLLDLDLPPDLYRSHAVGHVLAVLLVVEK